MDRKFKFWDMVEWSRIFAGMWLLLVLVGCTEKIDRNIPQDCDSLKNEISELKVEMNCIGVSTPNCDYYNDLLDTHALRCTS